MIKYRLKCNNCDKLFDSWFSSSSEFEKLKSKNILDCHFCNSKDIKKTLMAPNILNLKQKKENEFKNKKNLKIQKNFWNFKISLGIILKMWVMILHIKLDRFITIVKQIPKEYMAMQQKNR